MVKAIINPLKCFQCEKCNAAQACPNKAIFRIDNWEPATVDQDFCRGCGDCIQKCAAKAIILAET